MAKRSKFVIRDAANNIAAISTVYIIKPHGVRISEIAILQNVTT